ncbi:tyrosine-type recombinase/integrase [Leptolyngbya sp. GGD]|uniref:tyrosine-type recombinase/integrase n=1 Tax=Leptolyngbya sp. GGD TaxID=2997907 RepID=UPI00227C7854|nr:tyrosine-type recombinase/integrase [Leptolyngbya sp. GGD]MCY6494594.1 tyrosine-type recombinase/integrase [Leptolyngbya sp. GGD]
MIDIRWERYPLTAQSRSSRDWLQIHANLGSSPNTIDAYARGLNDYLHFCTSAVINPETARKVDIAAYVQDLSQRNHPKGPKENKSGLSSATIKQRLTIVRLYYDYLVEEEICNRNPASRGLHRHQNRYERQGHRTRRDLVICPKKLPWIPNAEEWGALLQALKEEPFRNRLMFAFAYDGALRRSEVCGIEIGDINPADSLLTIRAEISKSYFDRIVPYSEETSDLFLQYLSQRRQLSRTPGRLFLSESRRNKAQPISIWTWSKVIKRIAEQAGVPQFTTHTLRHLRLTDLARDGVDLLSIAKFAGHRHVTTTQIYIHLSGREVAQAVQRGMNQIHSWRIKTMKEVLQ